MSKEAAAAPSDFPDLEDDYWNFLQSVTVGDNYLPEEEEEDDPDFLDDLTNKVQEIVDKGLLPTLGDGQLSADGNSHAPNASIQAGWQGNPPKAVNELMPVTNLLQDPKKCLELGIEDTVQPPVCSRTRARHPMTDVDINELEQQLCTEEALIPPDENSEENGLWDLLNSPPSFNFEDMDLSDLDFLTPHCLEELEEEVDPSTTVDAMPQDSHEYQGLQEGQKVSCKRPRSTPDAPMENIPSCDFFSILADDDEDVESCSSVPTVLVDTPTAAIPMKTDAWSPEMIQQLHKIVTAHGKMLLQAYGLSVGHTHLMKEASEVQNMLDSISLFQKFGGQAAPYPRLVWKALKTDCPLTTPQESETSTRQPLLDLARESHAFDQGLDRDTAKKRSASIPRSVMDIPYADLLPRLWYTIKQLSCDPLAGDRNHNHEAQGRNFRTKGFCLLDYPPIIKRAFEPLQVFLPDLLSIEEHPRGPFWCKAEDLLLHWGLTLHPGDWDTIQQTYLPGKKTKEIENREGSMERRRRVKVLRNMHIEDHIPQVHILSPGPKEIQGCLEEFSRLAMTPYLCTNVPEKCSVQPPSSYSQPSSPSASAAAFQSTSRPAYSNNASSTQQPPCSSHAEVFKPESITANRSLQANVSCSQSGAGQGDNFDSRTLPTTRESPALVSGACESFPKSDLSRQQSVLQQCEELSSYRGHLLALLGQQSSQIGAIVGQLDDYGVSLLLQSLDPSWAPPLQVQNSGAQCCDGSLPDPRQNGGRHHLESTGRIVAAVANLVDAVAQAGVPEVDTSDHTDIRPPPHDTSAPLPCLPGVSGGHNWHGVSQAVGSISDGFQPLGILPTSGTAVSSAAQYQDLTRARTSQYGHLPIPARDASEAMRWLRCGFTSAVCPPIPGSSTTSDVCLPYVGGSQSWPASAGGGEKSRVESLRKDSRGSTGATPLVPLDMNNLSSQAGKQSN